MPLQNVNPGDLIKSSDWNDILAALNALDARVTELESGSSKTSPRIIQVLPTGVVMAGDTIRIFGNNFDYTKGGHSVTFGNTLAITFLPNSSDSLLIVKIPDNVEGATPTGTPMTMTVSNLYSFTTRAITIKSLPITTIGSILFTHITTDPVTPTPTKALTFTFDLISQTPNTTVTITPTTKRQLGGTLVDDKTIEVYEKEKLVANRQIPLPENSATSVKVVIPSVPNEPDVEFTLVVKASAPDIPSVIVTIPNLKIGHPSELPDPTVTVWQRNSELVDNGTVVFSAVSDGIVSGQFDITRGDTSVPAKLSIEVDATFSDIPAGKTYSYALEQSFQNQPQDWSLGRDANTPDKYDIDTTSSEEFPIWVVTTGTTTGEGIVTLEVTRLLNTDAFRRAVKYRIRLIK